MVTLTASQLIFLCGSLLDLKEQHKLSSDALDFMQVRINDPQPDGNIDFDIFLPPVFRRPCS